MKKRTKSEVKKWVAKRAKIEQAQRQKQAKALALARSHPSTEEFHAGTRRCCSIWPYGACAARQ